VFVDSSLLYRLEWKLVSPTIMKADRDYAPI